MKITTMLSALCFALVTTLGAQTPSPRQLEQERTTAEHDIPFMMDILKLKPGMTAADVGAGGGAMTVVLSRALGPTGRVYATDLGASALKLIRGQVEDNKLTNVTVIEGAPASTNLPKACCDAIFMRDVYHHLIETAPFDRSLGESLKPGGLLAIVDFLPRANSRTPEGVNPNRNGHGVTPAIVVEEVSASGLKHVQTLNTWPPGSTDKQPFFLVLFQKP